MYSVVIAKSAFRVVKKFSPSLRKLVIKELELLSQNPHQAPQLVGKFSFLRSWHAYFQNVPYRIIFGIEEKTKKVIIHLVAKRADVYRLLERLLG
mgnify:FL=1